MLALSCNFLSLLEACNQTLTSYNIMLAGLKISRRPFQILPHAIHWSQQKTIHSDLEFLLEIRGQPGNWIRVCFYLQQCLKMKLLLCFIDCLPDLSASKSHSHRWRDGVRIDGNAESCYIMCVCSYEYNQVNTDDKYISVQTWKFALLIHG